MFNNPELDAMKERYFDENARPSISTVMYLRDQEIKEAHERKREEQEKIRKGFEEQERRLNEYKEQERRKAIQESREALQYTDAIAQEICERIAIGELLINVCRDEHTPTLRRCNQWLREYPEFATLYQSALLNRLSVFEEEVIQIADDMKNDFRTVIKNGREKRVADPEQIARARLRIEVRFKHLKAGRPGKWGDISTLNLKSADEFDTSSMSAEELEKQIADIEQKSRVTSRAA
jgi:hypothetical protein